MKVEMFNVGWFTASAGLFRRDEPWDKMIRFPVPAYLIETDTERILVDTGLDPAGVADPDSVYGGLAAIGLTGIEQDRSIAEQVDLGALTKVVITHLHYDHVGGLSLVPDGIPIVVQSSEWLAGRDAEAIKRNFFRPSEYAQAESNVMLIDGEHDLLGDGSVRLLLTPGHTPGHQSVQIGDLVIGADVAHFASGLDDHRFPMVGDNHEEQARSADRLRGLRDSGLTVLPGHDPEVLSPGPIDV